MKATSVYVLFLSLFVTSNGWLFHKFSKYEKAKTSSTLRPPLSRKVVLVAKTAYFPVSVVTDGDGKTVESPFAPDTANPASLEGQQQQAMFYQPPPIMYEPSDVAAAYAAPVPVPVDPSAQYVVMPGYGAAGPYAQQFFAVAPASEASESWVMQYGTGQPIPAAPYSPTDSYTETEQQTTAPNEA